VLRERDVPGGSHFYYLDVPFEETLLLSGSRPSQ